MNPIETILTQDYLTIIGFALLLNTSLIIGSILFYFLWHAFSKNRIEVNAYQPIVPSDIVAVCSTLICNVMVFVLGAFLWRAGYLEIDFDALHVGTVLLQLVLLILVVDFWMYVFHKMAHHRLLYQVVHGKHHEHVGVNALSLFVLSPFEAIGFGLMLMAILWFYPFHYFSVGLYFVINVLWGTIGHFNRVGKLFLKGWRGWIGTASFHNMHHIEPQKNFGFYTTLWDRLFRTHQTRI
ncbi:sterol desaturase family protein [Myroides fluvii]|uniref:sterol desaturase family protein n=1 Tax=Myroides fluvii TaxID=2572594 RepID=UPI00131A8DFF|nr:sterol desaturase family protein [Myroides fluvii]